MADRILIVDDDEAILTMLAKVMTINGFEVDSESSGKNAFAKAQSDHYSVIFLDINLGDIDGFHVLQALRKAENKTPVIVVSGRQEDYDTLLGFGLGADDYVTKPFNPVILAAKAKALIRRSNNLEDAPFTCTAGPFMLDISSMRFFKDEREIPLSSKEYAMMRFFMDNVNRIISKSVLYEAAWDNNLIDEGAVAVYVNRLRKKIEEDPSKPKFIQTVRGVGYQFVIK